MPKYIFASLRGPDFSIEGSSPEEAWINLVKQEINNGSLWKTSDAYRNKVAVKKFGFKYLDKNNPNSPVYLEAK